MPQVQQFVFDINIRSTARVNAATESEARELIAEHLANFDIDWRNELPEDRVVFVTLGSLDNQSQPQFREMDSDMEGTPVLTPSPKPVATAQPAVISDEILKYTHGDPAFAAWFAEVDSSFSALFGISALDLPDQCWADWHADELTPAQAVQAALANVSY